MCGGGDDCKKMLVRKGIVWMMWPAPPAWLQRGRHDGLQPACLSCRNSHGAFPTHSERPITLTASQHRTTAMCDLRMQQRPDWPSHLILVVYNASTLTCICGPLACCTARPHLDRTSAGETLVAAFCGDGADCCL